MITRIDMHIRDERLLEWLQGRDNQQIASHIIADEFKCHANTARAMLKRLELAGYVRINRDARRGGYTYQIVK